MTAQAACTGGSDSTRLKAAGQGTRGAHFEHAAHGCDARRAHTATQGATVLLNCGPQRLGSELKTLVRYLSSTLTVIGHSCYTSPQVRYIHFTTMRKVTLRVSLAD